MLVTVISMLVADVGDILDDEFEILVTDLPDNEKKSHSNDSVTNILKLS